ncbi:MAG: CARDB domain-containing protein, partial [Candidatus Spechtbacterales bacterium]
VVSSSAIDGSLVAGSPLTFRGTVNNAGSANAGGSWVAFLLDGAEIGRQRTSALVSGASEEDSVSGFTPSAGNHTLTVCADIVNEVAESNEGNNCRNTAFTIASPPPPPPPDDGGGETPPEVVNPNRSIDVSRVVPCTTRVHFMWSFSDVQDGTTQTGYQLQIDNNSGFPSINYDTGSVTSSAKERYVTVGSQINFNTTYYWRIRVRDSGGLWSSYVSGSSFATPQHALPNTGFSWSPSQPVSGSEVQFSDKSTANGGAAITSWNWTFANASPAASSNQNPATTFVSAGSHSVTLEATDSDGLSCTLTQNVAIGFAFPEIDEVPPISSVGSSMSSLWARMVAAAGF